ncbi:MAG TPA: hypothetical protein VH107_05845 [Lacipirellulaceae bacterium]|nr:hypothetical protein [Lacipirellulaceae bacterium]
MNHLLCRIPLALLLALPLAGCQSNSQPEPAAGPPKMAAAPTPEAKPAARAPDLANPKIATAQATAFTPPFPDRLEIFEPPKRAQNSVKRDDEHGQSVELKGFIDVDQPRVILSIDGVVSPIPEGGEKYGVHVISIQPPSVVLQRGRNRWTATLE